MKTPQIKSVNITPVGAPSGTKWLSYEINGIAIAESHVFKMHGRYTKGKTGRSFFWHATNLEFLFGDKYTENIALFAWAHKDLVYGTGGTLSLKAVKEIIAKITE